MPTKTVEGVKGWNRAEKVRDPSPVHDRGPAHLSDLEGDYVHAVGLMNATYMFSVRSFDLALKGYLRREGITQVEAAGRMGVPKTHLNDWLAGRKRPSHSAMLRLRALMCGDQVPSSHDPELTVHTHRV